MIRWAPEKWQKKIKSSCVDKFSPKIRGESPQRKTSKNITFGHFAHFEEKKSAFCAETFFWVLTSIRQTSGGVWVGPPGGWITSSSKKPLLGVVKIKITLKKSTTKSDFRGVSLQKKEQLESSTKNPPRGCGRQGFRGAVSPRDTTSLRKIANKAIASVDAEAEFQQRQAPLAPVPVKSNYPALRAAIPELEECLF